jgi:excisionase family DNA binding protein
MEKLWTTGEVAAFLGITEIDVEELVKQGQLTGYKLGGQFLRFRPEQVEALKRTTRFRATPSKPVKRDGWWVTAKEFVYFYDFYLLSATCLALLVMYLIASS